MSSDVHFLDDRAIAFSGGATVISVDELVQARRNGDPSAALGLLLFAMIKATREVGMQLEKMAASNGDQAAAVRQQTGQMQANIDDAKRDAPGIEDVLAIVTEKLPEVLRSLETGSGLPLGSLMGGHARVNSQSGNGS